MGNSPTGPADIANRSIVLMGGFNSNEPLTGTPPEFDGTPLGLAAGQAYGGVVQTVGKQYGWDFARNLVTLQLSGGPPPFIWQFEYLYPTSGIEIRQLLLDPVIVPNQDPNNPIPQRWSVGFSTIGGIQTKVIWCNIQGAIGFISGQPPEGTWDALFTEQVIRLLASELGGAVGRPETSELEIQRSAAAGALGRTREG